MDKIVGIPSFSIENVQILQTSEFFEIILCIYNGIFGVISIVYFENHSNAHNSVGVHIKKDSNISSSVHMLV